MTEDRLPLAELLAKAGDGDFLRSVAEAVVQLLVDRHGNLGSPALCVLLWLVPGRQIGGGGGLTAMVVCPMPSPFLSIVPAALEISRVLPTVEDVTIEAGLARRPVSCPTCGLPSHRLHSHYRRVLRDLP